MGIALFMYNLSCLSFVLGGIYSSGLSITFRHGLQIVVFTSADLIVLGSFIRILLHNTCLYRIFQCSLSQIIELCPLRMLSVFKYIMVQNISRYHNNVNHYYIYFRPCKTCLHYWMFDQDVVFWGNRKLVPNLFIIPITIGKNILFQSKY